MLVTAAIIYNEGRVLLMRRASGKLAGQWEYPGGKQEAGESAKECMKRELFEELEIDALVGQKIASTTININSKEAELAGFLITEFRGEIQLKEHDKMEWVSLDKLLAHEQLKGDLELSKQIVLYFKNNA